MNSTKAEDKRCVYKSPTGRRCRNRVALGWNMCDAHCDFYRARDAAQEIVSNRDRLDTAEGIHSMMARTTRALAAGTIGSRQATSLYYGGQMMLASLARLRQERARTFLADEKDVWREKVLADSHHDNLNCEESVEEDAEAGEEGKEEQESESARTTKK
jgi:hypothetical protein